MIIMLKHPYSVTGMFRCGPAAVKAVYEQKVDAQYDVPFVYAAVNADVYVIIVKDRRILSKTVDKRRVGSLISTKHPGSMRMQNVTSEYKTERGNERMIKRDKNVLLKCCFHTKISFFHIEMNCHLVHQALLVSYSSFLMFNAVFLQYISKTITSKRQLTH